MSSEATAITTLDSTGRIVLPAEVRKQLRLVLAGTGEALDAAAASALNVRRRPGARSADEAPMTCH